MFPGPTKIKKWMLRLSGCLLCIALLQTAYFACIWQTATPVPSISKADLIIVFPGGTNRIAEGHSLAKEGYAPNLLIIGQTERSFKKLVDRLGALPSVNLIANDNSRSTFEDANIAKRIICSNRFRSVVLVTSSYHMPRSLFLLKTFLLDADLNVDLQYYPVEPSAVGDYSQDLRIYVNEMIKFWGSTAEMAGWKITHTLLRDSPFFAGIGHFVTSRLLFKV
jgi:uncharacterized SAM-binding protein YcdF (DUF218 family)